MLVVFARKRKKFDCNFFDFIVQAVLFAVEYVDNADNFQRVTHVVGQRLFHVGDKCAYAFADTRADCHHLRGKFQRTFGVGHKCTAAVLDVKQNRVRAAGKFLAHDTAANERNTVDSSRYVTKSVQLFVRRRKVCRLTDYGTTDAFDHVEKLFFRQCGVEAGDRFQLVDCSARKAEPSAAHLGNVNAAARKYRRKCKRRTVADTARTVLVHNHARNVRHINDVTAVQHCVGHVKYFTVAHTVEQNCHKQRRNLIVGNCAVGVAANKEVYFFRRQFLPGLFLFDYVKYCHFALRCGQTALNS